jgi:tripartite-type tricarboxylate transporter receptor subunit TctC
MTLSPSIRGPLTGAFTALAALCVAPVLHAGNDFPARPVRIIVGFPPGGATDFVARSIAPRLGEALKQPVVIDNRPGANGTIAAELASNATPDGYNLHLGTLGALVISPAINKVGYVPQRDLLPISLTVQLQNIFIAHPAVAVRSMADLIALARQKPGQLNYASSGLGSPGHLAGELFKATAKVDLQHVAYKGGAPALGDLVSGQVPVFVAVISTGVPVVKNGRAIALAVTGSKRSPALPDVPTVAETAGMKGYEASNWYGLMAPAGTPRAIIDRLHRDTVTVMNIPELRDALAARGVDAVSSSPEDFTAYIRSETAKWNKVIRVANLKPY